MKNRLDPVTFVITIISVILLLNGSFVYVMKNRVSKMVPVTGFKFIGSIFWFPIVLLLIIALINIIDQKKFKFSISIISSIIIVVNFILFMTGIDNVLIHNQNTRVSFGLSFYAVLILLVSLITKNSSEEKNSIRKYLPLTITICLIVLFFITGFMDKSSIMIEYHTRKDKFISCLIEHVYICWSAILTSVLFGIPLSYLCYKNEMIGSIVMGFLNLVRSIPAIALIMIMITPLSFLKDIPFFRNLGISSFGFTPVYCALVFYSLFIIISNITSAFKTINEKYVKVARGIGLTDLQILYKIQFPIILPVFISGLKVAVISTFTAASLGTMVGFGGLGTFIVMGSGNAVALDLILLGSIPIIILIFTTNLILTLIIKLFGTNYLNIEYTE